MSGFDLLDPGQGIFASAHAGRGAVVFEHGAVLAAGAASDSLGAEFRSLTLDGASLSVEIGQGDVSALLGGAGICEERLTVCPATAKLGRGSGETEIACPAIEFVSDAEAPPEGSRRSIAVVLSDGGLLAVAAERPPAARGHGEEITAGVIAEPARPGEGSEEDEPEAGREHHFDEVLLSTEYGSDGMQRRATLELWPPEDSGQPPVRGAGTILCGTTLEAAGCRIDIAFFRWSIDGRPGFGRYEIVSAL